MNDYPLKPMSMSHLFDEKDMFVGRLLDHRTGL